MPWTGLVGGDRPTARLAEFAPREAAAVDWIHRTFDRAVAEGSAGVVVMMQAEPTTAKGYSKVRAAVTRRAAEFAKPVLLVHGDEHRYEAEPRYAGVPNLTRLETFGDTATHWLKVTADSTVPGVFSYAVRTVT
ncbi:hypothetical protein BH18ACT9_BH18ACT9_17270 [soil metagenome]